MWEISEPKTFLAQLLDQYQCHSQPLHYYIWAEFNIFNVFTIFTEFNIFNVFNIFIGFTILLFCINNLYYGEEEGGSLYDV